VLIVEDLEDAANSLAMLLRLSGYPVALARTGLAAIELAVTWMPDVVLLDLKLPDLHGYQVAERLRASPRQVKVPILAVTGYASAADFRRSAAAGLALHLVKPVDPDELLNHLERIHWLSSQQVPVG
jgi:CheY-like chemotaxis protein